MSKLQDLFYKYDKFAPPKIYEELVSSAHQTLIDELDKPHRKLILQIIDNKDLISKEYAEESFRCGFYVAYKLMTELNNYNDIRLELELSKPSEFLLGEE